jgi:hypothetical protein
MSGTDRVACSYEMLAKLRLRPTRHKLQKHLGQKNKKIDASPLIFLPQMFLLSLSLKKRPHKNLDSKVMIWKS